MTECENPCASAGPDGGRRDGTDGTGSRTGATPSDETPSSGSKTCRARRPWRGSKEQNAKTTRCSRPARVQAHLRADARDPRLEGEDPDAGDSRGQDLQLLEGRRPRARDLAADDARVLSDGQSGVGDGARRGRAGEGRGQGLGLPRRDLPAAGLHALPDRRCRPEARTPP